MGGADFEGKRKANGTQIDHLPDTYTIYKLYINKQTNKQTNKQNKAKQSKAKQTKQTN